MTMCRGITCGFDELARFVACRIGSPGLIQFQFVLLLVVVYDSLLECETASLIVFRLMTLKIMSSVVL
jgi:hypothetical protein